MNESFTLVADTESSLPEISPSKKKFRLNYKWTFYALLSFLLFSILKMPYHKLEQWGLYKLNQQLERNGLQLQVKESSLSLWLGMSYTMEDAKLFFLSSGKSIEFTKIKIEPHLLSSLFSFSPSGGLNLELLSGSLHGDFSYGQSTQIDLQISKVNFEKSKILQPFFDGNAQGILDGTIKLTGNPENLSSLDGQVSLQGKDFFLDTFPLDLKIFKITIPALQLGPLNLQSQVQKGKISLSTLQLGNADSSSDLDLAVSGSIQLQNQTQNSNLDLVAKFKTSDSLMMGLQENIQKTIPGIEISPFLEPAKSSDGSYRYKISGTLSYPNAVPEK